VPDEPPRSKGCQGFRESIRPDFRDPAEFSELQRLSCILEGSQDRIFGGSRGVVPILIENETWDAEGGVEFQGNGVEGWRLAMFDGEGETLCGSPSKIEIGVTPGMKLGRPAKRLPGSKRVSALFRVVNDHDRRVVGALEIPELGEKRCDLSRRVLVDPVETHEGVKDDEPGTKRGDCVLEPFRVPLVCAHTITDELAVAIIDGKRGGWEGNRVMRASI
jgi:hypothetical protein